MRSAKAPRVTSRRHRFHAQRGFTLVELLVVIAMVGIMSTLAVVSYRKIINSAQASEAKSMIQGIRVGEEAYKAEMLVYLSCSTSFSDFYPQKPNDTKMNWVQPGDKRYTDPARGSRASVSSLRPVRAVVT